MGPSLVQSIFDAGLRRATVQQFQASYDQTVANYRQTVLTAFQQVEDNLAALRILAQVLDQEESAMASAERSLQDAEIRYRSGLDPYLNVISAQTALLNVQQSAVNVRAQQPAASVQLIKALGRRWDVSQISSVSEPDPSSPKNALREDVPSAGLIVYRARAMASALDVTAVENVRSLESERTVGF